MSYTLGEHSLADRFKKRKRVVFTALFLFYLSLFKVFYGLIRHPKYDDQYVRQDGGEKGP